MSERLPIAERFYRKVRIEEDGCWRWVGAFSVNRRGKYPILRAWVRGQWTVTRVHRWVLEQVAGKGEEGMEGCHRCDRTWCVNPDHLYWGTREDNVEDWVRKYWRDREGGDR